MKENNTKKIAITAMMAAIAVVGSTFSFPIFGSKCAPVQHMVNVLCAVFLGPWYGLAAAFIASVIRNLLGLGTLLAFPGSMCGALLSGLLYRKFQTLPAAYAGEVFGTAVIGGILAFPIARLGQCGRRALYFRGAVFGQHRGRNGHCGRDHRRYERDRRYGRSEDTAGRINLVVNIKRAQPC